MGADWREHVYDGEKLSMVFTATQGGPANRQAVTKEIRRAAKIAGLEPDGLASHSGRRTVVTALYTDGGRDLIDVTSATPAHRQPPSMSAASDTVHPTRTPAPLNSSPRRSDIGSYRSDRSGRRDYRALRSDERLLLLEVKSQISTRV